MVDLSRWFGEAYAIPGPRAESETPEDDESA